MNEMGNSSKGQQYISQTVQKALDILNLLAKDELTASEISAALGQNKTTIHRLLYTLEEYNFIEHVPGAHSYRIGIKLVGICGKRVNEIEIIAEAKPVLMELVQQINQPVHLGTYDSGRAVFIDKIDVVKTIRIYSAIGKTIPVHCSAIGKSLLLDRTDDEVRTILERYGMPAFTEKTITDPEVVLQQLRTARECGYTEDNGEHERNVCCLAAPIYDYRNKITAAISTAMPDGSVDGLAHFAPILVETAKRISKRLGANID